MPIASPSRPAVARHARLQADCRREFQAAKRLDVDGDVGPKTRAALHTALLALSGASTAQGFHGGSGRRGKDRRSAGRRGAGEEKADLLNWIAAAFTGSGVGVTTLAGLNRQTVLVIGSMGARGSRSRAAVASPDHRRGEGYPLGIPDALKMPFVGGTMVLADAALMAQSEAGEVEAAKSALNRIQILEKSSADFKKLPSRDHCFVFMRDSGLPDTACD